MKKFPSIPVDTKVISKRTIRFMDDTEHLQGGVYTVTAETQPYFEVNHTDYIILEKGRKIKFYGEQRPYTIRAFNDRYAICTKPFNPTRTVIYTVVDFENKVRSTKNLLFGFSAVTDSECEEMLGRLTTNETELSRRNSVKVNIV